MYFGPSQRVNAANTGFLWPKVPIHRKLRHEQDVGVNVLRRNGDVQILVLK
jgi:hypothetical protein